MDLEKRKQMKLKEQETLKKIFPNHQINLVEDYNGWDLIDHNKKRVFELKNRNLTLKDFTLHYGLEPMLEKSKYDACMNKSKELGYKFIFINYFTCGSYIAINMSDMVEPFKMVLNCPEKSYTKGFNYIDKECYIIKKEIQTPTNTYIKKIN